MHPPPSPCCHTLPLFYPCCSDYVFQQRKFGGNAQAITGKRWLHHTSFLWDYRPEAMALLQHPPKAPEYREVRGGREVKQPSIVPVGGGGGRPWSA